MAWYDKNNISIHIRCNGEAKNIEIPLPNTPSKPDPPREETDLGPSSVLATQATETRSRRVTSLEQRVDRLELASANHEWACGQVRADTSNGYRLANMKDVHDFVLGLQAELAALKEQVTNLENKK